jgi:transcriptional regulator with XRE-family HTH domain
MGNATTQQREKWAIAIVRARQKKDISQQELASLSGKSISYIQKIENRYRGNEEIVRELLGIIAAAPGKQRRAS